MKPMLPLLLIYNATVHCYVEEAKIYFSVLRSKVTDGGSETSWSGSPFQLVILLVQFHRLV